MPVRDKPRTMIKSEKEREQRWKEHFEKVLSHLDPNSRTKICESNTNFGKNTE